MGLAVQQFHFGRLVGVGIDIGSENNPDSDSDSMKYEV